MTTRPETAVKGEEFASPGALGGRILWLMVTAAGMVAFFWDAFASLAQRGPFRNTATGPSSR